MNTLDDFVLTKIGFMDLLKNDDNLNSFTGLSSFDLLDRIVLCMRTVQSIQSDLAKLPVPLDAALVLVLIKLKTNMTFKQCAVLFQLHRKTVSNIFCKMLPLLRTVLQIAVFWPTKEMNSRNIPECFKPDFVHCRAVCDCTEVGIEKPKSVTSRIK